MMMISVLLSSYQVITTTRTSHTMRVTRRRWKPIWGEWQNSPRSNWTHPPRCVNIDRLLIYIKGLNIFVSDIHLPSFLSPKKVDFLRVCGLTTLAHRDELLTQKKRKRRRMMRERSLSPPAVRGKRKTSSPSTPTIPLTTPYSAEQMDSTPELEEKKDFLLMFNLSHVNPQQRRGNNLFSIDTHPTCYSVLFTVGKIQHAVSLSFMIYWCCRRGEKKIKLGCIWRGGCGRIFYFILSPARLHFHTQPVKI